MGQLDVSITRERLDRGAMISLARGGETVFEWTANRESQTATDN